MKRAMIRTLDAIKNESSYSYMERKVPKYGVRITQKIGKERGKSYGEKMKRSSDERHTQTHGSLIGTFRRSPKKDIGDRRNVSIKFRVFVCAFRSEISSFFR